MLRRLLDKWFPVQCSDCGKKFPHDYRLWDTTYNLCRDCVSEHMRRQERLYYEDMTGKYSFLYDAERDDFF